MSKAFDIPKKIELTSSGGIASEDWKILCVIQSNWFNNIVILLLLLLLPLLLIIIIGKEMKLKGSKEYFRRLKKVLKSNWNCGNLVRGHPISTFAQNFHFLTQRQLQAARVDRIDA